MTANGSITRLELGAFTFADTGSSILVARGDRVEELPATSPLFDPVRELLQETMEQARDLADLRPALDTERKRASVLLSDLSAERVARQRVQDELERDRRIALEAAREITRIAAAEEHGQDDEAGRCGACQAWEHTEDECPHGDAEEAAATHDAPPREEGE